MNQISHSDNSQISKIDALAIINFLQFSCASGFTKNYAPKLDSDRKKQEFLGTVKFMISDLSQQQLERGLLRLRDCGFCPDLNLFRRWCLGLEGFEASEYAIRKTYLGADAALAHVVNYTKGNSTFMTNAIQKAYQDVYFLFLDLSSFDKPERLILQVHRSFKQCYQNRVDELVKQGIAQEILEPLTEIGTKKKTVKDEFKPVPSNHRPHG